MSDHTPGSAHPLPDRVPLGLWIGGHQVAAASGKTFAVHDPATGAELARVADAGPEDALEALRLAHDARGTLASTTPRERSDLLRRMYELTLDRAGDLARVITLEMGKPLDEALGEVRYAASYLRWFAEEAVRVGGRYSQAPGGRGRILVTRAPVGVCLAVTPWNFPLAMATRKIAPALAAGCPIIAKPASATPLTMLLFGRVMADAGTPAGVTSVLPSSSASALTTPLLADPRLRKLTFTGSTAVGKKLIEASAPRLLRTSMELGGNAPFLVFADADLDAALDGAMIAKTRNGGEACTAANRFLVEESVAAEFSERLAARMDALRIGHGLEDGVEIGPLISDDQVRTAEDLVADAVGRGARLLCGGSRPDLPGHFYRPTVLVDVPADARILREEVFAPVAPVVTFTDEDQAIAMANDTEYGLVAYAYTRDLDRALRLSERLESGMVGINRGVVSDPAAPFGGIKESGHGREGGSEGIEEYLDVKYVAL